MELNALLSDLAGVKRMLFVISAGDSVSELYTDGKSEPRFEKGYATLECDTWHFHLNTAAVKDVQFVEADDHGTPRLYYVRFADAKGETLLRAYFPNPYLDDKDQVVEFQPEKLELFENVRDRHVGMEGIVFVRRRKTD